MFKKFSFWIIFILIASIGSIVSIHWNTIQGLHQRASEIQPLYQRQKILDSLSLQLERYRRLSSTFRKITPEENAEIKSKLKAFFIGGVNQLDRLNPTSEEFSAEHQLNDQLAELLSSSVKFEQMLFTKDAYQKAEIQSLHDEILKTLENLEKINQQRISAVDLGSSQSESRSLVLLLGVGLLIFILVVSTLLRGHFIYYKPLERLYQYALSLRDGAAVPKDPPVFSGMYGEIQASFNRLATSVETHVRGRHKFIMDLASDLKVPLALLQSGGHLLGSNLKSTLSQEPADAAESVRRGLAIFAGSLDDLNDLVDINRLDSRLDEKTVDLAELIADVGRTLMGPEVGKKMVISVPPLPVWVFIDAARMQRLLIQVFSKVLATVSESSGISVELMQHSSGNTRGVELVIQDMERLKSSRPMVAGPEQEILKHWISENGLSMALAHKVIKAHGGSITAAGVAGTSLSVIIRLPQDRIVSPGLISPPQAEAEPAQPLPGLVTDSSRLKSSRLRNQSDSLG
ncbi:MAG: hypothetical protein ACO3A2_07045 [Bdellovibrionia bacterium]